MFAKCKQPLSCLSIWNNLAQAGGIFTNLYVGFLLKCIDSGAVGYYLPMLQYLTRSISDLTNVRYMKMYVNLCLVG